MYCFDPGVLALVYLVFTSDEDWTETIEKHNAARWSKQRT